MNNRKRGISLVVLVITIIVIIVLAAAIILSLVNNNPIGQTSKATFLSDSKTFEDELNMYQTSQFANNSGGYNPNNLQADNHSVTYNGMVDTSKTISDIITSLKQNKNYENEFQIINGKLVFTGYNMNQQDWAKQSGINVVATNNPELTLYPKSDTIVKSGNDMIYTLEITSGTKITNIDLTNNLRVLDSNGNVISTQPIFDIGTLSGVDTDITRQIDIRVKTDTLSTGDYSLKLLQGAVTNSNNLSNDKDITALDNFTIDNTIPENPIMTADNTAWTNSNVTIAIIYSQDSVIKQYSFDAVTWNNYTSPVIVSDNNTTVYARGYDIAGNESGVATFTVANIDKEAPVITVASGAITTSSVTITANATDSGGSSLNASSYQYSDDNGLTWTDASSEASYTFTGLVSGSYQCKVKVKDNAGNITTSDALSLATTNLGQITMSADITSWTNGNVTITAVYPTGVITKQYSLDGTIWNTYTAPIIVSTNNTTIYAKGIDAGGNQTAQATFTVSNIDKIQPTITVASGTATSSSVTIISTASDIGGSGLNISSYQYSDDNGVTWTNASSAASYTFTGLVSGTYQCKVKVNDNAGNTTISNVLSLATTSLGQISMSANITSWTNGNVTITAVYPTGVITKQYSLDGTTWNTYTAPIIVSTNNTTIYAKGIDAGGNQTAQATFTVSNIDKTAPSIPVANFNGYTPGTWTNANITLNLTSTDANSGISKYQWSTNGTVWNDFSSSWTYNYDTSQTTEFRSVDNAGNASSATSYYTILRDATGPSYSSYQITNVTSDSYDVYFYGVSDAGSGVNRVQFPTWTTFNGQDDLVTNWSTNSLVTGQNLGGGTWKYTAKRSEHNNEYGDYLTHVYLYDNLGNYNVLSVGTITLTDPNIVATFYLTSAQQVFNGSTSYSKSGEVMNNYTIEFDAQPSDTIDVYPENNTSSTNINYKYRYIIHENWYASAPDAGLGISLGTNGIGIIAHSAGYYHILLTYYANLNAWNHYKIVVQNRVPTLYINGTLIKTGYAPLSSYTQVHTPFVIGVGSYGNYVGTANNFVFYNTVK